MTNLETIQGGCACGALRFTVEGEPLRVGLCHCMTCRKAHAAAFNPFVVYPAERVRLTGQAHSWRSSPDYDRLFCPTCGSRVISRTSGEGEVELSLGSLDEPGLLEPHYECWVTRREAWLPSLPVPQYSCNCDDGIDRANNG